MVYDGGPVYSRPLGITWRDLRPIRTGQRHMEDQEIATVLFGLTGIELATIVMVPLLFIAAVYMAVTARQNGRSR